MPKLLNGQRSKLLFTAEVFEILADFAEWPLLSVLRHCLCVISPLVQSSPIISLGGTEGVVFEYFAFSFLFQIPTMAQKYTFRCRMCNLFLFDEDAVIHPDHTCFSTCKNYVGSRDIDLDESSAPLRFGDRYASTPKDFRRVFPKRQSDENAEWEDVDGSLGPDATSAQVHPDVDVTDFTVDTSKKGLPAYRKTCTSIFLDYDESAEVEHGGAFRAILSQRISDATQDGEMAGVIDCPQCTESKRTTRLGKFAICGAQCSCSKWITPAVQFVSSKIDIRPTSQLE